MDDLKMTTLVHSGPRGSVGFNPYGEPLGEEFGGFFLVGTGDVVQVAEKEWWRYGADRVWRVYQGALR